MLFNYLVEEEFIEELSNPMRRIKSLKEEKRVIVTFNNDEVKRIITDVVINAVKIPYINVLKIPQING